MMFFAPCGASLKASVIFVLGFSSIASTLAAPVVGPAVTGLEARSATITATSMPQETSSSSSSSSSSAMSNGAMSNGELQMSVTFEGDPTVEYKSAATTLFGRLVKGFAQEQFKVDGKWKADDVNIKDLGKLKPSGPKTYTFDLSGFSGSKVTETGAKYRGEMELVASVRPIAGRTTLSYDGTIKDAATGKVVYKVKSGRKVDISKGPAEDTKNAEPTGTFKAGSEAPSSTSTSSAVASSKT
ncbi:hypothetical protein F5890DRAFT_670828 [Lentinula detonsa]|uniref:Uncharacterized protein n=1 Tax=Lentinula detonsa TaxID=2804962 RepID=A0AA38PRU2_9AGAR|nr:hypothetical protein F5890DRAFT_670828 [Lentinula detonsa]